MRFPAMAPRGAWGREAKHSGRIGLRSLSPYLGRIGPRSLSLCSGAQSLTVSELARIHPSPKRIGIFPRPWVPSPWDSSFSLSQWAPAKEAKLIEEEQEVWGGKIVAVT